jgi:hypothetical protein
MVAIQNEMPLQAQDQTHLKKKKTKKSKKSKNNNAIENDTEVAQVNATTNGRASAALETPNGSAPSEYPPATIPEDTTTPSAAAEWKISQTGGGMLTRFAAAFSPDSECVLKDLCNF